MKQFIFIVILSGITIFFYELAKSENISQEMAAEYFGKAFVQATGESAENQARYPAMSAARAVAQRNLLEEIQGLAIDGSKTVEKGMLIKDTVNTKVRGFLRGAVVVKRDYNRQYRYGEITMRAYIHGKNQNSIYKSIYPILQSENIILRDKQLQPTIKSTHSLSKDSLIIDIHRKNFMPALNNRILNEQGDVVYAPSFVVPIKLAENGLAGYTNSIDKAKGQLRMNNCKKPLIIDAYKIKNKTDIIVHHNDAIKIIASNQQTNYLSQANVCFVIH